jgi:DNA-binding SARP family transcriptional activator/tetratricopeptide (TPR) repeat protein
MPRLELTLLGGFAARDAEHGLLHLPRRKAEALLAYLACGGGSSHPRDKLAALLWPDVSDAQARHSLRQTLASLRQALPPGALRIDGPTVGLDPDTADVDVLTFRRLAAEGTPGALAHAAAMYGGDFLAGLDVRDAPPFEEWLQSEREALRDLALTSLARVLAWQRDANDPAGALHTALRLLALDPLQEVVHRTVMRLMAAQGRRDAALRQYQTCVDLLQRELGVEPEAETKQLYREILRQREHSRPSVDDARDRADLPAPASPPAPLGETALVGRRWEMDRLRAGLDAVWDGRGIGFALLGEAGIGKSRLAGEMMAEATVRGGRGLVGCAHESEQILAFGVWRDLFRVPAMPREVLSKLDARQRADLAPLLSEAPGSSAPTGDALQEFEAVTALLAALAGLSPTLVLLEDVHWADEMSLRLLAFATRRLASAPVAFLVTAREEELAAVPYVRRIFDEFRRSGHLEVIALSGLSAEETAELIMAATRTGAEATPDTGQRLWAVSGGNPFVVLETLRAAREAGAVAEGRSDVTRSQRIRELVNARVERLGPHERSLAAAAAVLGQPSDFPLLSTVAGVSEDDAAEAVETLVRSRLLRAEGEQLVLTHDWLATVIYHELVAARRTILHRRAAKALEAEPAAREPLRIGLHYARGGVWDKAALHLERAAVIAARTAAYHEATQCADLALDALAHLPASRECQERQAEVLLLCGLGLLVTADFERGLWTYEEAERLAVATGDAARVRRARHGRSWTLGSLGRHAEALAAAESARALASESGDQLDALFADVIMDRARYSLGRYEECVVERPRVADVRPATGGSAPADLRYMDPRIFPVHVRSRALARRGEFAAAIRLGRGMLDAADRVGRAPGRVMGSLALGQAYLGQGEIALALPPLEQAASVSREAELWIFSRALWPRSARRIEWPVGTTPPCPCSKRP